MHNGMEHESILTSLSSSSSSSSPSSSSSSLTHHTHTSSALTIPVCNSSTALKEKAVTPALSSPPESTTLGNAQPINLPDHHTLGGGLGTTESPMSKACLSSMIPECREKYDCMEEGLSEHLMHPNPPEHKSTKQGDTVTDKSFMGITSAINAMNGSMNTSRLCNINLASALETYAAVIHSHTTPSSSAIEADRNKARANCFSHAAVFWMEWATVQANLQLSLMQDLFKLKSLAGTPMECESDAKAEVFDADSIRAMVVKLTKLSHNSFKEAYEKGTDWSSVGGLNYWISQLPEPVVRDVPTIIITSDHTSTPPRSVADTADLIAATDAMKIEQVSLRRRRNGEDLRLSNKLSSADLKHQSKGETRRVPGPFNHLSDGLTIKGVPNSINVYGIDEAFCHNNERTVHSFRYRQKNGTKSDICGDKDLVSIVPQYTPGESIQNRKQHLTRSHQTLNLDRDYYSSAAKDHNNQVGIFHEIEKRLAEHILEEIDLSARYGKTLDKDIYHNKRTTGIYGNNEEKPMEEVSEESTNRRSSANSKSSCSGGSDPQEFPHNNCALGDDNPRITKNLAEEIGNIYNQDAAILHNLIEKSFIGKDTDFNKYIASSYVDTTYQGSDSSVSHSEGPEMTLIQDIGQDGHEYDKGITPVKANDPEQEVMNWASFSGDLCSSYLSRPLPYAITEEDSCNKTPPLKKGLCQLGVELRYTTPPRGGECSVEISRPGNIRRKGKFEKKDGAIHISPSCRNETSSPEDEGLKGKLTTVTGGNDESDEFKYHSETVREPPIITITGVEQNFTCRSQQAEIPFLDGGGPLNTNNNLLGHVLTPHTNTHVRRHSAKPLEPNLNPPDQYPSRGYFSEDFQRQLAGPTFGEVGNPFQDKQRSHFRWSSHLKKMVAYVPRGDEPNSPPMGPKSARPMSPTPTTPNSRTSGRRMSGLSCL